MLGVRYMEAVCVAIDGPASSGKSTVAKLLAKSLGFIYVDTGAMYRTITLASLNKNIDPKDESGLLALLNETTIKFDWQEDGQHVWMNGQDVTDAIRSSKVTNLVSEVSMHPSVRQELVARQREMARDGNIVMDGRDIGTTVLPNAQVKVFLVASVEERAKRRYKENLSKQIPTDFEQLKKEIEERDFKDSHRQVSPLIQAEDAQLIDTTSLSIDEVVAKIKDLVKKQLI